MIINITYDSSAAAAPAGFKTEVAAAVSYLDSLFTNNVTVNIAVGWGEVEGQALPSNALGSSIVPTYYTVDYASAVDALKAVGAPGSATLPASSPFTGSLTMSSAEAKALGLLGASAAIDGYVGFSSTLPFSLAAGVAPAAGQYYLLGVIEHEITEDLGRVSLLNYQPTNYAPIDLFRYTAPGVRDLSAGGAGATAYFSLDNGVTSLGVWNNDVNGGDLADWRPALPVPGAADAMNDYTAAGVRTVLSPTDLTLMKALGWTTGAVAVGTAITGITESPTTGAISQGGAVTITVNFNTVAIVTGVPTLTLNDGGIATYVSGSGTSALTFHYTVANGDTAVAALAATGVALNGGAIVNDSGLALNLSLAGLSQAGPQIVPAPVWINGQALTVYLNHGAPAAGLIASIVNPGGDAISQYGFLDTGAGGGHFTVGGVTQTANVWILVPTADLASVQYVGGTTTGVESVQMKVYDATSATWSPVTTATAITLAPVPVVNTAAWVSANLDSLQAGFAAGSLGAVTLTDAATPTLMTTAAQLGADAGALSKITSAYFLSATGVMGAVAAASVSAAVRTKLTTAVSVSDSALNVGANLAGLQALASAKKLAAITLTDAGVPTLTIAAASLYPDAGALGLIVSPYSIAPTGLVGAVAASRIPAAIAARLTVSLSVADTCANLVASLSGLQTLAAAGGLGSITLSDATPPTLTVSAAQLSADATVLVAIKSPFSLAVTGTLTALAASRIPAALAARLSPGVTISDSATNVAANLAGLQLLAAGGALASITLTNVGAISLTVTAAQVSADWGALSAIATPHTLTVTGVTAAAATSIAALANVGMVSVVDSGAAVAENLDALEALASAGRLGAVLLTDAGAPALLIAAGQVAADAAALARISSAFSLSPTGSLGAAAATSIPATIRSKLLSGLVVSDSAANVLTYLGGLQTVSAAGKLASVALTDVGTPTLALTATQVIADAQTLSRIVTPFGLTVSGTLGAAAAAGFSATLRPHLVGGLAVSDSAANIVASLSGLQSLAVAGKLLSIALNDPGTPILTLTAAQVTADTLALGLIVSPFGFSITGALGAASAAKLVPALMPALAGPLVVSDSSTAIVTNLTALQSLAAAGRLATVILTNATAPVMTLTAAQLGADPLALAAIASPYAVSASGTSAAFSGDGIANFAAAGSVLDVTDLNLKTLTASFTENAAATAGVLTLDDGAHKLSVTLFGQLMSAGYAGTAASAGIVAASDGHSGVRLTYNAALAISH